MDTVADMGGMQGFGTVELTAPDDPPFHEDWEKRAFAMGLLSMRISGTNLNTFRYGLERQDPIDYLAFGYYGRWLKMVENLLVDSSIIAPGAIDARARKLRGEDVEEPPAPEPDQARLQGDRARIAAPGRRASPRSRWATGFGFATSTPRATPACPDTCGGGPARYG